MFKCQGKKDGSELGVSNVCYDFNLPVGLPVGLGTMADSFGLAHLTSRHMNFLRDQENGVSLVKLKLSSLEYFRLMSSSGTIQIRCYFQPL